MASKKAAKTVAAKRGRGRPPLPQGEVRGIWLHLRLNGREWSVIEQAAGRAGLDVSEWARGRLLDES